MRTVLDRSLLRNGGVPKTVARTHYHIDQDFLAWDAAKVAAYYNNALLVIENNSLRKTKNEDSENHFISVLNEIEDYYDNLYSYQKPGMIKDGVPIKWGFFTGSNKVDVVNVLKWGLRDYGFIDYDVRLFHECDTYEIDTNGKYNAVAGEHDDIIMSTAIGLYVSSQMDTPRIVENVVGRARANVTLNI